MAQIPYIHESKRLHFSIRDYKYRETPGYGYFIDYVLATINEEFPKTGKDLIERIAFLMLNPKDGIPSQDYSGQRKNEDVFKNCLPSSLRKRFEEKLASAGESWPEKVKVYRAFFGTAGLSGFGCLRPRATEATWETGMNGAPMYTIILYDDMRSEQLIESRGYLRTLARNNNGLHLDSNPPYDISIPEYFPLRFSYPIPGTNETLPLMKIGTPDSLMDEIRATLSGPEDVINRWMDEVGKPAFNNPNQVKLIFLHPNCTQEYYDKLLLCMNPLLKTLDTEPDDAGKPSLEEKIGAMATLYWLIAQSTPVVGGGTALSNILLEHMAYRLRSHSQSHDLQIPYFKGGSDFIDLWAQAATSDLATFKSRFKDGLLTDRDTFFDSQVTDAQVEEYLNRKLSQSRTGDIQR
jgi:hypothetical protein